MAKTILLADDNPAFVKVMKLSLELEGYNILTACDGEEALHQIHTAPPDLILLDVNMPKLDGMELSDQLKASEQFRKIPIILFSDLVYVEGARQDMKGVYYLAKPFETHQLLSLITQLIGN